MSNGSPQPPRSGKPSTEPYKGVRDFYPRDMFVQRKIFSVMRETAESFGYDEYDASVLEPAELYRSKSSEEIVSEQTYTFTDRGDREVTLRPEMTPTAARMVAAKRQELPLPIRWYSIPNLFRYERPQRGRLREHWQLNVDIFGVPGIEAELEIISVAHAIMRAFGIEESRFEIRLNDRAALLGTVGSLLRDPSESVAAVRLIDRKEKMRPEAFDAAWKELSDKPFSLPEEPGPRLKDVIDGLFRRGIGNARFSPSLARGFDYYTGLVFEVYDNDPANNRSLFGGGRYDNLLDIFGAEKIPAVGFGMGDVTMRDVLETYGLIPAYRPAAELYLCRAQGASADDLESLAASLRTEGLRIATDITERRIGDQIKAADRMGIPRVAVIGAEEIGSRTLKIKDLATREESSVAFADIPSRIRSARP